jgi:hypothetical protein
MPKRKHTGGTRAERLMAAWLERIGYEVERRKGKTGLFKMRDRKGSLVRDKAGNPLVVSTSQDVFRCLDILAMRDDNPPKIVPWKAPLLFLQITTANERFARKKKIEWHRWPSRLVEAGLLLIAVATHETTQNPTDRRSTLDFWRLDAYAPSGKGGEWEWQTPISVEFSIKELVRKETTVSDEEAADIDRKVKEKRAKAKTEATA